MSQKDGRFYNGLNTAKMNCLLIEISPKTINKTLCFKWGSSSKPSLPVAPSGVKAISKHHLVITGQSLQFSPLVAMSPHVCLRVLVPRVSWSALLPFPLRVPGECLPWDVRWGLPKGVANPFPASLKDFNFYRLLSRSFHRSWLLSDDV